MLGIFTRVTAMVVAAAVVLAGAAASPAAAASPEPAVTNGITLSSEPLLGGVFAPGAWVAIRVSVANDGPPVDGELRLSTPVSGTTTYSIPVQLANGARQEHFLYSQGGVFGNRLDVVLHVGETVLASQKLSLDIDVADPKRAFIVSDRPETVAGPVRAALLVGQTDAPVVTAIRPQDLPERVEAWSSIDVLVWHDVSAATLTAPQLEALQTWTATGGDLLVVGGSSGTAGLAAFPASLLPYRPAAVVDVPLSDLEAILGSLPAGAATTPALSGPLDRGTAIAQSGSNVIAARGAYGQGQVTLLGLDPTAGWLAGSSAAATLWEQVLPPGAGARDARLPTDDSFLVNSLGTLPAIQLPSGNQLLLLILGYIVAIGPVNYFILKRRDRREWAWLTLPLTIAVFAIAAYAFGVVLKGGNVIVNQLVLVQGAAGADRGLADVHVGVFSPGRSDFDLKIDRAALISAPTNNNGDQRQRPLDVVLGDPATVRHYGVGFGALRAFRAQTAVGTPRVDADFGLTESALAGTVTNSSVVALDDVSVIYAGDVQVLGDMAPGESRPIDLRPGANGQPGEPLSWRLYPDGGGDLDRAAFAARRALVDHLAGGWNAGFFEGGGFFKGEVQSLGAIFDSGPVILAWQSGGLLDVDAGRPADQIGQTLYVLPARVAISGHIAWAGGLLRPLLESIDSPEGYAEGGTFYLTRGTIAMEYRPLDFDGTFSVSAMSVRLSIVNPAAPSGSAGTELAPLPPSEQPASDSPLASNPRPGEGDNIVPRLQLFDRDAGAWVEFEPVAFDASYVIPDPAHYVDPAGAFRVRFVVRTNDYVQFGFAARIEGTVE